MSASDEAACESGKSPTRWRRLHRHVHDDYIRSSASVSLRADEKPCLRSTEDCTSGIPEIYLVPSGSSDDNCDGNESKAESLILDVDYDYRQFSSTFFGSSSDEKDIERPSQNAASTYFRDTPRGEPMGSESVVIQAQPATNVTNNSTLVHISKTVLLDSSEDDDNISGRRVDLDKFDEDKLMSRRGLWLREDVEGADDANNVPPIPLIQLNVNLQSDDVRPPLVGQSEDSIDLAISTITITQDVIGGQGSTTVVDVGSTFSARSAEQITNKARIPINSRRDFYNAPANDNEYEDDDVNVKGNSSTESTDSEQPPTVKDRSGYHSDHRASSPSVISVASSVASSKRLEWDSGADIGYGGPRVLYGGLSTLERMAIGSFFKRTEPEGKSALAKDKTAIRPVKTNIASSPGQHDNGASLGALTASLEDIFLFIAPSTDTDKTTESKVVADLINLNKLHDQRRGLSNDEDDDRDTEDEIAECCREFSTKATSKTVNSQKKDTFLIAGIQGLRSSSMIDLSCDQLNKTKPQRLSRSAQSRSTLDITTVSGRHLTSASSRSIMDSSSSSSTVVDATVSVAPNETPESSNRMNQVVQIPFCSTVNNTDFPPSLNFETPSSHIISGQMNGSGAQGSLIESSDSFDQKWTETGRLIAQLATDPRWAKRRHRLIQAVLSSTDRQLQIEAKSVVSDSRLINKAEIDPCALDVSSSEVELTTGNVRPEPRGGSGPSTSSNTSSSTANSTKNIACELHNSIENIAYSVPPQIELQEQDVSEYTNVDNSTTPSESPNITTAQETRDCNPHSKYKSDSRASNRSTSSSSLYLLPIYNSTERVNRCPPMSRRYPTSSSERSESTLDTIREQKRRYPQRRHRHEKRNEVSGTLASSFEFYGVPMSFKDVPSHCIDVGLVKNQLLKKSSRVRGLNVRAELANSKSSEPKSTVELMAARTVTNSEESRRATPNETAITTINSLSAYTSETSSNICVQSSASGRRTTTTTNKNSCAGRCLDQEYLHHNIIDNLDPPDGLSLVKQLVQRQRESYICKLKREMDWLERIEAILIGDYTHKKKHVQPNESSSNIIHGKTQESYNSTRLRSKKIMTAATSGSTVSRRSKSKTIVSDLAKPHLTRYQKKDFGQCFPTPQLSECESLVNDSDVKVISSQISTSVGVQTSDSVLNTQSKYQKSRPTVNIPLTTSLIKRKNRTSSTIKRQVWRSNAASKHPPVSWFVPLEHNKNNKLNGLANHSQELTMRGRADGAQSQQHSSAYSKIKVAPSTSIIQNVSLQEAFRLLKSDVIKRSRMRQDRLKANERLRREAAPQTTQLTGIVRSFKRATKPLPISAQHHNPQPRFMSEREMRGHTEKLYQELSEVTERQELKRRENAYKTNRQMANVFKKVLQEKVLRGIVSMPNSQTCT